MNGPLRAETETYSCRCVVLCFNVEGRCGQPATPDSPFCPDCEDRHPEWADAIVSVAPLPSARC
jgi:hypothetical protein